MFGKIFALDDTRFKHSKLRSYGKTGTRLIYNELALEYMQFSLCTLYYQFFFCLRQLEKWIRSNVLVGSSAFYLHSSNELAFFSFFSYGSLVLSLVGNQKKYQRSVALDHHTTCKPVRNGVSTPLNFSVLSTGEIKL